MFASFGKSNSIIKNGKVLNSDIDMSTKVISSHGTPLQSTDVVNKTYCDQNTAGVLPIIHINLVSTNWENVLPIQSGDLEISVFSTVQNGPCGKFLVSKNDSNRHSSIVRTMSFAGTTTNERLEIRWRPFEPIQLRKTGLQYNGQYRIRYSLNN